MRKAHKYLEKQDFILAKQKEQLAAQQSKLDALTLKVSDMETLLEEVSAAAYDKAVEQSFSDMLGNAPTMMLWMVIICLIGFAVCFMGLQNGIEKISKVMMSALLIIMVILAVHSVMMEGAGEGIRFYLIPDFQKIKEAGVGNVVFAALSQSFFTLSIGIGAMLIFGSYLDKSRSLTGEATLSSPMKSSPMIKA